jgi:hypothetical protein
MFCAIDARVNRCNEIERGKERGIIYEEKLVAGRRTAVGADDQWSARFSLMCKVG